MKQGYCAYSWCYTNGHLILIAVMQWQIQDGTFETNALPPSLLPPCGGASHTSY